MQQCAMHNATIQKTTFFELGVMSVYCIRVCVEFFKAQTIFIFLTRVSVFYIQFTFTGMCLEPFCFP